jgi:hypothetical protein
VKGAVRGQGPCVESQFREMRRLTKGSGVNERQEGRLTSKSIGQMEEWMFRRRGGIRIKGWMVCVQCDSIQVDSDDAKHLGESRIETATRAPALTIYSNSSTEGSERAFRVRVQEVSFTDQSSQEEASRRRDLPKRTAQCTMLV